MKFLLVTLSLTLSLSSGALTTLKNLNNQKPPFSLPPLPYGAADLEPVIDTETMTLHHDKHHQTYVDNLNKALSQNKTTLLEIMQTASQRDAAIRNNGGGHWNHSFFWSVLAPAKEKQTPGAELLKEITATFTSLENFQQAFEKQGTAQFGSGWVWLIRNGQGKLEITSTGNQDNPLMDLAAAKGTPILGLDVWEHAYYLKYQNKRADYIKNFWDIVNWKQVSAYNAESKKTK